jgi:hypothetical protein
MLIEQVDGIDLEPLERRFGDRLDVLGTAVQALLLPCLWVELEAER